MLAEAPENIPLRIIHRAALDNHAVLFRFRQAAEPYLQRLEGQNAPIQGITDPYKELRWALERLAGAFRLIARKGYLEGAAGHISLRDPQASTTLTSTSTPHCTRPTPTSTQHAIPTVSTEKPGLASVYDMFGRVAFEANEGERIVAALGNMRCAALKDHGLLTTGKTVGEMAFLYSLMENSCRVQLLAEAAAASEIEKHICSQEEAEYTYRITTPEAMLLEFQPDYEFKLAVSGEFF
ncbi:hypothetical protein ETB97_007251 [Aspergillus alliaceus]|uniref:Class II aldolase/adducin N-terminal domain-containing protein n=1 Tax=Petromyces alliaceus TaxID=209559 RepID=A0A8H5ZYA2_PETAA|nr:hypothetical protein ETB97_007251 [Aspergillus burnettii]